MIFFQIWSFYYVQLYWLSHLVKISHWMTHSRYWLTWWKPQTVCPTAMIDSSIEGLSVDIVLYWLAHLVNTSQEMPPCTHYLTLWMPPVLINLIWKDLSVNSHCTIVLAIQNMSDCTHWLSVERMSHCKRRFTKSWPLKKGKLEDNSYCT